MKRALIFVHRWLGIVLCLVFLIWFPSGIGMMYWTFPAATTADRLERLPALDRSKVALTPAEAYATLKLDDPPGDIRLTSFDGRPAYRFDGRGGPVVYADTGEEQVEGSRFMVNRAAAAWTGKPVADAQVVKLEGVDQWTVSTNLSGLRPVWKFSWPSGEQVYVSEATGEVVQHTTTASRIGAYLGPIPHWFYVTALRRHGPEWSRVVIWSSGIGTFAAILGLAVAAFMYSPAKRYRYDGAPSAIPYRGQKRWHMVLGLVFGIATATWAFSGMLSMDPFPGLGSGFSDGPDLDQALRGQADMAAFAANHPRDALARLDGIAVKELELTSFAGEPVYMAHLAPGDTRIVPLSGPPRAEFGRERIVEVITRAVGDIPIETRLLEQSNRYYLDRTRRQPLPVILATLEDEERTRYYVDPKTARIVGSYGSSDWVQRWAYNGLHSLNFPWLYNSRPLWDIVVIAFMLGGTALCVTSLVLAWRVLGRRLRAIPGLPRGRTPINDDLALADSCS